MPLSPGWTDRARPAAVALLVALAIAGAGAFAAALPYPDRSIALIGFPVGIAAGAIHRFAGAGLAGAVLGAALIWLGGAGLGATRDAGPAPALAEVAGEAARALEALACLLAAWASAAILRRARVDRRFARLRDFLVLAAAALAGSALAATLSLAGGAIASPAPLTASAMRVWLETGVRDLLGVLLVTPLILASDREALATLRERRVDVAALAAATIVLGLLCAGLLGESPLVALPLTALFLPLVAWAGVRIGVAGTAGLTTTIAVATVACSGAGIGPFVYVPSDQGQILVWQFVAQITLGGLATLALQQDRARTRAALERSEWQSRMLVEQSGAGIAVSEGGSIAYVNEAFARMLGRSRDALIGRHFRDITHADDDAASQAIYDRHLRDRSSVKIIEKRYVHADGHPVWAHVAFSDLPGTQAPRILVVVTDITARREAEQAARSQSTLLRTVLDATGAGVWDWDMLAKRTYFSPGFKKILGYQPEADFYRLFWLSDRLHPEDRERVMGAQANKIAGLGRFDEAFRLRRADGTYAWVHGRGEVIRDARGAPIRFVGSIEDISARTAAEHALRESQRTLNAVIDAAYDGIVTFDPELRIQVFNRAAERMFGRLAADVAGQAVALLVPERYRVRDEAFLRDYAGEDAWRNAAGLARVSVRALKADGTEFPVEVTVARLWHGDTWLATAIVRDVSGRRALEAARAAQQLAEANDRAKTAFLSRMSHELRTPLNAIMGFTQLLRMDARRPLDALQREHTTHILSAGEHLLGLIGELLDTTRIEAGAMTVSLQPVAIADAIADAIALVGPIAHAHGVAIRVDLPPQPVPEVRADDARLRQVLLNLLSNGIKYNRPGGDVVVRVEPLGERMAIAVRDTGIGFDPSQSARMFAPFERLGHERGRIEGTGIGLALSRGLIELMGGTLEADGRPGQGATFTVTLPVRTAVE